MSGRRAVAGVAGLVGLAAVGFLVVTFLLTPDRDFDATSGLVSGVVGALGFIVAVIALLSAKSPEDPLEALAAAVTREWGREAVMRGLDRPEPLRVRWGPTDLPVTADHFDESGDVTTIADVWRGHPARQLVILGEAGAGKTSAAVILVRSLLRSRAPGEAVPLLLNLADWDPEKDHLDTWLTRKLKRQYRFAPAAELVGRDRIVPVLDGLDEMPPRPRARAITALTQAVGMDRPLVVTCRTRDYEALAAEAGSPLARAAVVEIQPVDAADAIGYLPAGQIDGEARWRPVLDRLRDDPDGPLATALRTPLMVFLAREEHRGGAPERLLRTTDVDEIEAMLLAGYVPAVYRNPGPARPGEKEPPRYPPADVARWLGFLAAHMARNYRGVFRWWALKGEVPRRAGGFRPAPRRPRALWSLLGGMAAGVLVFGAANLVAEIGSRARPDVFSVDEVAVVLAALCGGAWIPDLTRKRGSDPMGRPPTTCLRDLSWSLLMVAASWTAVTLLMLVFGVDLPKWHVLWLPVSLLLFALASPTSSYGLFHLAAWRLSRRGLAPFRLMPFLEDAYRRGVLRKAGGEYQFRHARLAQHLAATQNGPGAEAPGPSTLDERATRLPPYQGSRPARRPAPSRRRSVRTDRRGRPPSPS